MKNKMILFGGLLILLLSACGNKYPAETQPVETVFKEQEASTPAGTDGIAEAARQELENLVWEDTTRETIPEETQPKQTPNIPATTPKQDSAVPKPTKPKPTESVKPTEENKPVETTEPTEESKPVQTTEPTEESTPTEPSTEPTKPSEDSGNPSPEWTPPVL